jgi:hypothetical protein
MANILGENFVENVKMETDSEETESLLAQIRQYLQINDGHLKSTFWSGNLNGNIILTIDCKHKGMSSND